MSETLAGLIEAFAEVGDVPVSSVLPFTAASGDSEEILVSLLEQVIFVLDVFSVVPVRFHLAESKEGSIIGTMDVVDVDRVSAIGPSPKAVSYHELSIAPRQGGWWCHVLIDV